MVWESGSENGTSQFLLVGQIYVGIQNRHHIFNELSRNLYDVPLKQYLTDFWGRFIVNSFYKSCVVSEINVTWETRGILILSGRFSILSCMTHS